MTNEDGLPNIATLFELADEKRCDLQTRNPAQGHAVDICDRAKRAGWRVFPKRCGPDDCPLRVTVFDQPLLLVFVYVDALRKQGVQNPVVVKPPCPFVSPAPTPVTQISRRTLCCFIARSSTCVESENNVV